MDRDRRTSNRFRRESFKKEESRRTIKGEPVRANTEPKKIHKIPANTKASKRRRIESSNNLSDDNNHIRAGNIVGLPTIRNDDSGYTSLQSLADSAVLAASLTRSRDRWIHQGVFERYWTKPSKKKGQPEGNKNPAKESMHRLGPCKLEIAPHIFDVTLFTVKEDAQKAKNDSGNATSNNHSQSQLSQHTQPQINAVAYSKSQTNPAQERTFDTPAAPSGSSKTLPVSQAAGPASSESNIRKTTVTGVYELKPYNSMPPKQNVPPTPRTGNDPVIQMLAHRASTNSDLKELMKIVASGQANPSQLRVFQSHIDDLSNILRKSEQTGSSLHFGNVYSVTNRMEGGAASNSSSTGTRTVFPQNTVETGKTSTVHSRVPNVSAVVLQFNMGSSDRFLFPKQCIAERLAGDGYQARLTFIANANSLEQDARKRESYEAVSIVLRTESSKVLDIVLSTLSPAKDVRRSMVQTMLEKSHCEQPELMLKLPEQAEILASTNGSSREAQLRPWVKKEKSKGGGGRLGQLNPNCSLCYAAISKEEFLSRQSCSRCFQLIRNAAGGTTARVIEHKAYFGVGDAAQHLLWTSLVHS